MGLLFASKPVIFPVLFKHRDGAAQVGQLQAGQTIHLLSDESEDLSLQEWS